MREASTNLIYQLAHKDKRVMAITADGRNSIYERIKTELPDQYMDYGIAEQNMMASAAGLASCGKIPFIFGTSTFLAMRAFEFIRNDICIPNMNVKLLGIFSGVSRPSWGATHQGTEEIALLRCLPNLLVVTPSTPIQAREATRYAYDHAGPVYIRLEASGEPEHYNESYEWVPGKAYCLLESQGKPDVAIVSMGSIINEALAVANALKEKGIGVQVIDMPTVKPIDKAVIEKLVDDRTPIVTLEEHSLYGGLGSAVAEVIAMYGHGVPFRMIGLDGCATGCGSRDSVRRSNNISFENVMNVAEKVIRG